MGAWPVAGARSGRVYIADKGAEPSLVAVCCHPQAGHRVDAIDWVFFSWWWAPAYDGTPCSGEDRIHGWTASIRGLCRRVCRGPRPRAAFSYLEEGNEEVVALAHAGTSF